MVFWKQRKDYVFLNCNYGFNCSYDHFFQRQVINFAGDAQATAEQSSSFSTKEILGYLWPKELLKKHGKEVPKRLQSIQHQGKNVKGVIMEDWVLGTFPFIY